MGAEPSSPAPSGISPAELQRAGVRGGAMVLAFAVVAIALDRLVPRDAEGDLALVLLGVAAFASGRLMRWILSRSAADLRARLPRCAQTRGVVVSVERDWNASDGLEYPYVRFTAVREAQVQRTARPMRRVRPGDDVHVRFDPSDPCWVVIDDGGLARIERALRFVPTLATVVAAGFVLAGVAG